MFGEINLLFSTRRDSDGARSFQSHVCSKWCAYYHGIGLWSEMCRVGLGRWFQEESKQKDARQAALSWNKAEVQFSSLTQDKPQMKSKKYLKVIPSIPLN